MSKQDTKGQYWSIQDKISQCLRILGNISPYWTISVCFLQHHNSDKIGLEYLLENIEQYWIIFEGTIGQYSTKFCNIGQC